MSQYRGYSLLPVRFGRTEEADSDEYLWQIYRPDGKLMGERWTYKGATDLVDSLLDERDPDGDAGGGVDGHP